MSDLEELVQAAGAAPGAGLLRILVQAARAAQVPGPALDYLAALDPKPFDAATREGVAAFLLEAGAPEPAAAWAAGAAGSLAVLQARALLALGREAEARARYMETLTLFPQLRDARLDSHFAAAQARLRADAPGASGAPGATVIPLDARRLGSPTAPPEPAERPEERVDFSRIGGLDAVKAQIRRRIILPFERKGLFERFRKRAGGGVLLYGPPGCGKTLIARATAAECGASFTAVAITDVLDKWIGESEKRVAALFAAAREKRPAVLFFDEVEALAARRRFGENGHQASLVSTFLNEMDGFRDNNEGILILAATNTPWAVDSAFRRPGRFDRSLFIPPPDRRAREAILALALDGRPVTSDLALASIAEKTNGFSGADLANVVETACDLAIERSIAGDSLAPVTAADLRQALKEVRPTTAEWLAQARNYARFANEGGFYDEVAAFLDRHGR